MIRSKSNPSFINKIINLILIICLGGVGPLVYFDAFTPDHTHPYHLSLFEPPHTHTPLPLPPDLIKRWLMARRWAAAQMLIPGQAGPGLPHLFQSSLSHGYLLTITSAHLPNHTFWVESVHFAVLLKDSIRSAPPDKPPRLSSL